MIRKPLESEAAEIAALGEEFWKQTEYSNEPYDMEKAINLTLMCIKNGICFVDDRGGIKGFIMMLVAPNIFTDGMMAVELAFYVTPDSRGSGARLMLAAEKEAKSMGCDKISMFYLESVDPDTPHNLYIRLGYKKAETTFTKKI